MDVEQLARGDVVSAARLSEAGHSDGAIAAAVRAGLLVPLLRGWYSVRPARDARDLHWLRATAGWQRFGGRALLSHQSLLVAQNLPDDALDLGVVHLTRRGRGTTRNGRGLKIHRPLPELPPALSGALPDRVPTAVGIVQAGLEGLPLSALVAADAALHRALVTTEQLDAACGLLAGRRGIGPVRAILREADDRIESPGESIIGHRLRGLGYTLDPQFEVTTDLGPRFADFRIRGTRVLVEFDGARKYGGREAAFEEKRREDAMRRRGFFFARYVWSELDDIRLIGARAAQAVADSRRWAA
jgi:very-short-patch-repair endonuclease